MLRWTGYEEKPHIQSQRNPGKMRVGANLHLEWNLIPTRDAKRAQTNLVLTRTQGPHKDWDRTVFECLLWQYGSAVDCHRDRSSGCSRHGTWVWHKPSWRKPPLMRNRLLEGTNRTLCTRIQEKGAMIPQETDPDLPVSIQESPAEAWVGGVAVHAWDLLKEVTIIFITSTIVWPQLNNKERTPWTVWKGKMVGYWNRNSPGW